MADRRDEKRQWGHTTDPTAGLGPGGGAAGAPGTTGAFRTSDPLGAPGSTGAGITHHDPSFIPGTGGAAYLDPDVDFGGQEQQRRHPASGADFGGGEDFDAGRRQHATAPGVGGGKHQPASDVGRGDKSKFEGNAGGEEGVTGFSTTTTTATAPGGMVYGRQTRAVGLGSEAAGGSDKDGKEHQEKRGMKEKAKDLAERIPGVGGRHHTSSQ